MSPSQLAPTTRIIKASPESLAKSLAECSQLSTDEADRLIRAWIASEDPLARRPRD